MICGELYISISGMNISPDHFPAVRFVEKKTQEEIDIEEAMKELDILFPGIKEN